MNAIQQIYKAAARAGLLRSVTLISAKQASRRVWVEWRESDDSILHDLVLATEITITFPTAELAGIRQSDLIVADGKRYQVRDVRAIHDGSETRARLSPL